MPKCIYCLSEDNVFDREHVLPEAYPARGREFRVGMSHLRLELAGAVELLLFLGIVHFGVEINLGDFE